MYDSDLNQTKPYLNPMPIATNAISVPSINFLDEYFGKRELSPGKAHICSVYIRAFDYVFAGQEYGLIVTSTCPKPSSSTRFVVLILPEPPVPVFRTPLKFYVFRVLMT